MEISRRLFIFLVSTVIGFMLALVVAVGILVVRGPAGQVHAASPVAAGTEDLFEEEEEADNRLSEIEDEAESDDSALAEDEVEEGGEGASAEKLGSLSPEARALFEEGENPEGDELQDPEAQDLEAKQQADAGAGSEEALEAEQDDPIAEPAEQPVEAQELAPIDEPEPQPGVQEDEALQEAGDELAEPTEPTEPTEQDRAEEFASDGQKALEEVDSEQQVAEEEVAAPQAGLPELQPKPGDRDGDGIPDRSDKCIDQPEDKDGFESLDGCPDPDNDDDGVLDAQDRCPFEKENLNGYADSDGCPDEKPKSQPEAVKAETVEKVAEPVKAEPVPTPEGKTWSVYFGHMRWALDKSAKRAARRSVRSAKRAKAVYIRGQSDSGGRAAVNRWYANKRAKAVRRYLVAKGVPMSRITIMDAIIIDGDKVRRSKSNRRVDVIVVK